MEDLKAQQIQDAVRSLIVAEETNRGVEVSTPVAYPGGDLVNVIVENRNGGLIVHDGGFAASRLALAGVALTKHVVVRLAEYARRFECIFENRRVTASASLDSLEFSVAMVANASRSVADYALEIRKHAEADFRAVVFDALREIVGDRLKTSDFVGKSGRRYRLSAVMRKNGDEAPLAFIAPIASHSTVPHNFAMLYDLGQLYSEVSRQAVYDETADLRPEDKSLLRSAGEVYALSEARHRYQSQGV
jgi:hypothetical protein